MSGIEWYFRQRDPGEALVGGVNDFAFQMSIDTLVRETIQNANDQRIGDKVQVELVIEDHKGVSAETMLDLVGWDNGLNSHLEAIKQGDSHLKRRAEKALDAAKRKEFRSLTIRDIGARGLEGEEDGDSGNFAMLCRHVLVTDSSSKTLRGGAFGIGKSVLWAFSGASVALFSSLPMEKGTGGKHVVGKPRVFGRAYLVSHRFNKSDEWHNGDGHYGQIAEINSRKWATSLRDKPAQDLVKGSSLERDWKSTGTSILIPFLDNPRVEEELSVPELLKQIREAVQKWFWPSISSGILSVKVGQRSRAGEDLVDVEIPKWATIFKESLSATATGTVDEPGGAATAQLEFDIPERIVPDKHPRKKSSANLFVKRLQDEEINAIPQEILNSIALIRGAQMVVSYYKDLPALLPPFVGVVQAGLFKSADPDDEVLEVFLRDSEPPAHDRWDTSSENVRQNYKLGGLATLKRFYEKLSTESRRLLGGATVGSSKVPKRLAEMLRGGAGGKKTREEKYKMITKEIDRQPTGHIEADIEVERKFGKDAWKSVVAIVLVDDQGTNMPTIHGDVDTETLQKDGIVVTPIKSSTDDTIRGYDLTIPATISKFALKLEAELGESLVAKRSLVDVTASCTSANRSKS